MKSLYESLLTGNVRKPSAKAQPSSKKELQLLISVYIDEIKPHPGQEVGLNWIDISKVDDLSELFRSTNYIPVIDTWKIDHVKNFSSMFRCNRHIVRSPIPILQEKLLDKNCYAYMFCGCKSLKIAPELPATELTKGCYYGMFYGCISLEVAPQLPAMGLAEECYWGMFCDCEKLKAAPELPATELEPYCYRSMFHNCKSLKNKTNTPFGKPIDTCYAFGMYRGCPCENK